MVLNAVNAGQGATTYGYSTSPSIRPSSWQSSTTFTVPDATTKYYFFAKYAGNGNYNEAISAGSSEIFNGMNTDLQVELLTNEQDISAYQIADVTWDASTATYSNPEWVSEVEEWINAPERDDNFKKNLSAYQSPSTLAQTTSDIQDAFFSAIAADSTLLASLEKIKRSGYFSDPPADSDDESAITKYYALFTKLTFGTYLIHAGPGFNPVVKNIFPDRDAAGYKIPTLVKASLKGGGLDLEKTINGHDTATVAVGNTVSFDISFNRPSGILDTSFVLTDIMSSAFNIEDLSSVIVSTNADGSNPLASGTYYTIGPKTSNLDGSVSIPITFVAAKIDELEGDQLFIKYDAIVTEDINRLYPTTEQEIMFAKTFGCCRKVYNLMLADKIKSYEENKTFGKQTPAMYKTEYQFLKEVDSLALANVQLNLQGAMKNCFDKSRKTRNGFPKFKSAKLSKKSYTTNNQKGTVAIIDGKYIKLPKIGKVKAVIHRQPEAN